MKFLRSSVDILGQEPGIIGMKKHIERCSRISYKSEDHITDDSYIKFINMLHDRGHWACFEFGTVYLRLPEEDAEVHDFYSKNEFSKVRIAEDPEDKKYYWYITSNYRVLLENNREEDLRYWFDSCENHYHRVTSHWICSRTTSHQIVRNRVYSYIQESQRYVNYGKDKFGSEITYIIPEWIYDLRKQYGATIDPVTFEPRDYILNYDENELIDELCGMSKLVKSRYNFWKACEDEYLFEVNLENNKLNPEDARGVLCNDTKTELCMCGYLEDWFKTPPQNSPEKIGFFFLRSANSAQHDIRRLSRELESQMREKGYDKLF